MRVGCIQNCNRVPISETHDLALKLLRVHGKARHEKREYEENFHWCILYQILLYQTELEFTHF